MFLLCTNVYAYCGMFTDKCIVKDGDKSMLLEMQQSIRDTILMSRIKYINSNRNVMSPNRLKLNTDQILNLDNCYESDSNCKPQETINEYTDRLIKAFIESGVVENDKSSSRFDLLDISLNAPDICHTPMMINLYTGRNYSHNNVLYCLKDIIDSRINEYSQFVNKKYQQQQNLRENQLNNCKNSYYNSKEYKSWLSKRDSFVKRRNKICINNGYSALDCYSFSLKDQLGYELQYRAPKNNCGNQ